MDENGWDSASCDCSVPSSMDAPFPVYQPWSRYGQKGQMSFWYLSFSRPLSLEWKARWLKRKRIPYRCYSFNTRFSIHHLPSQFIEMFFVAGSEMCCIFMWMHDTLFPWFVQTFCKKESMEYALFCCSLPSFSSLFALTCKWMNMDKFFILILQ